MYAQLPAGIREVVNPYPPTPFQTMLFYCSDPVSMGPVAENNYIRQPSVVLLGPQFSRVNIKVHKRLQAIRVDFYPGAIFRLLAEPMHQMVDTGLDAQLFFGAEMREIQEKLLYIKDLEAGKDIVEKFLLKKVDILKEALPFDAAMKIWRSAHRNYPVEAIASMACLSLKQFERKCKERLGMNPSVYARILRFSSAYRLRELHPQLTWTAIAHSSGYFDQMHMIRDFKLFAGVNPSVIQQQLDATPLRMQRDLPF